MTQITTTPMAAEVAKFSVRSGNNTWKQIKKKRALLLMVIPGMLYFVIFDYIPMYGILIAFQDYRLMAGQSFFGSIMSGDWVGFEHFIDFFESPNFLRLLRNTFLISFYSLLIGFPAPILFALLLNEVRHVLFKRFVQTVSYLPHFISTVAVVGMLKMLISPESGLINTALQNLTGSQPYYYFGDPAWFRTLYIGSGIWQGLGWSAIIYLAAISKIDTHLYESAAMDGANRLQQMVFITLPLIRPTIIILFILSMSGLLAVGAEKIILMYSPATYETADVFATYIYRRGLVNLDFSFGAAVGLLNSVVNVIFLVSANYAARKFTEESLW